MYNSFLTFVCWWTSRLLPCPGYYKQCCDEHWGARVSFNSGFLGVYTILPSSSLTLYSASGERVLLLIPSQFSSVQSLSCVQLFVTPWIAARQASLSITNSWSSLRLMSIESMMPSSHLILCCPLLLLPPFPPSIRVFPMSQLFTWGGQSTGVSALASFLPKKSQGWSP